jgi:membrane-associated PAP2 superfamily phosphatase
VTVVLADQRPLVDALLEGLEQHQPRDIVAVCRGVPNGVALVERPDHARGSCFSAGHAAAIIAASMDATRPNAVSTSN